MEPNRGIECLAVFRDEIKVHVGICHACGRALFGRMVVGDDLPNIPDGKDALVSINRLI